MDTKLTKKPEHKTIINLMKFNQKPEDYKNKQNPDKKPNPNQDLTNSTKPSKNSRLSRKLKTLVVQKSELKTFLAKKKQEKDAKLNLKVDVPVTPSPPPSIEHDSATLPCTSSSLLLNAPPASDIDEKNVIIERDLSSSAREGDLTNLCGDLVLADEQKNLGEKPIV